MKLPVGTIRGKKVLAYYNPVTGKPAWRNETGKPRHKYQTYKDGKKPKDMTPEELREYKAWLQREHLKGPEAKERHRARQKRYYDKTREERIRKSREWQRAHPVERRLAYNRWRRKAYRENPEKFRESGRKWRSKNPDKFAASMKRWNENNRPVVARIASDRRARMRGAMPESADIDVMNVLYEARDRITQCTGIIHHVDHIVPISRGGLHHQANMRVIPASVNHRKWAKSDEEFSALGIGVGASAYSLSPVPQG